MLFASSSLGDWKFCNQNAVMSQQQCPIQIKVLFYIYKRDLSPEGISELFKPHVPAGPLKSSKRGPWAAFQWKLRPEMDWMDISCPVCQEVEHCWESGSIKSSFFCVCVWLTRYFIPLQAVLNYFSLSHAFPFCLKCCVKALRNQRLFKKKYKSKEGLQEVELLFSVVW